MLIRRAIILFLYFIPFLSKAQADILILEKRGMHVRSYAIGDDMDMETVYHQWIQGTVTDLRNDSVFINGLPFHYKEIATLRRSGSHFSSSTLGIGMMIAGAGIFILGGVNGLIRGDQSKNWYTTSGLITGGILAAGGFLLTRGKVKKYSLGGRYKLQYLVLNPNKK
jgi:hypothetical protein